MSIMHFYYADKQLQNVNVTCDFADLCGYGTNGAVQWTRECVLVPTPADIDIVSDIYYHIALLPKDVNNRAEFQHALDSEEILDWLHANVSSYIVDGMFSI